MSAARLATAVMPMVNVVLIGSTTPQVSPPGHFRHYDFRHLGRLAWQQYTQTEGGFFAATRSGQ